MVDGIVIPEDLRREVMPTSTLVPYIGNAKKHPEWQVEQIANSSQACGFNDPIGVRRDIGGNWIIIEGHGRLQAAKLLGMKEVPVIRLDHLDEEAARAYMLAHNQLTMNTEFDMQMLEAELDAIEGFDMSEFGFEAEAEPDYPDGEYGALSKRFIVPPFSVLDTRSGAWQERKRWWREITGDLSETRDGEYGRFTSGTGGIVDGINGGTSNFDPVLAEVMMKWFCPEGGSVLDPFGGEQTKGVVAGETGHPYTGVEIRQEQVDVDREHTAGYPGVEYICGASTMQEQIVRKRGFDMCLTSPPYYDREVYSAEDMSALGTYEEFMQQYRSIFAQCYRLLADNSFLVVKVGEIRDKKSGEYRNFVSDTISAMLDAGFIYYDEIILVTAAGTARLRATKSMRSRKVCKVHQNVLVFYKGDLAAIQDRFPALDFTEVEQDDSI